MDDDRPRLRLSATLEGETMETATLDEESDGVYEIKASLVRGDEDGEAAENLTVEIEADESSSSADFGRDVSLSSTTVTIPKGLSGSSSSARLMTIDDSESDGGEIVVLRARVTSPSSYSSIPLSSPLSLTLLDADGVDESSSPLPRVYLKSGDLDLLESDSASVHEYVFALASSSSPRTSATSVRFRISASGNSAGARLPVRSVVFDSVGWCFSVGSYGCG